MAPAKGSPISAGGGKGRGNKCGVRTNCITGTGSGNLSRTGATKAGF